MVKLLSLFTLLSPSLVFVTIAYQVEIPISITGGLNRETIDSFPLIVLYNLLFLYHSIVIVPSSTIEAEQLFQIFKSHNFSCGVEMWGI